MTATTMPELLAIALLIVLGAIATWDIYAAFGPGWEYTVSALLGSWAARYPMLPFAAGILAGHLFWPQHLPERPRPGP